MATDTYYFDGSDAAASDPDSAWTDETNADDGNVATLASTATNGSESSNYLQIEGTNSPSSGGAITQVRARVNTGSSFLAYSTLSAPAGGWTWEKLQGLEFRAWKEASGPGSGSFLKWYEDGNAGSTSLGSYIYGGSPQISKVEIEVTSSSSGTVQGISTIQGITSITL